MAKKLNLGSGPKLCHLKGYKNIDFKSECEPDELYDFKKGIREEDSSVDEILFSHSLMYCNKEEVIKILKECLRVLKNGGVVRITEDNRQLKIRTPEQMEQYGKGEIFTRLEMENFLRLVGFSDIRMVKPFKENKYHLNLPDTYPLARGEATVYFLKARKDPIIGPIVYLFLDDFGEENNSLDLLWRLRKHFDNFRVTLFAIPNNNLNDRWREYILSLGWIRLGVHGYNHLHFEELDDKTLNFLPNYGYDRIYRPPYLELTEKMAETLKKTNYRVVLEHNWLINVHAPYQHFPQLFGTGHIYPYDYINEKGHKGESLFWYWQNILSLPKNTNFKFLEEL